MKTDFLASGNHFLPFFQTPVNWSQWKSFFFNWNTFFSQSFILASENEFFVYWKQYFFIPSFFLLMENITETWGSQILKTNHIPASGHQFFSIFSDFFFFFLYFYISIFFFLYFSIFLYFLKWKSCFRILEAYFSISFIWLVQTNFLPTETVFFWSELFCYYWKSLV